MELQKEIPELYLRVKASSAMREPPISLVFGPFATVELAQAKYRELDKKAGYEYTITIGP